MSRARLERRRRAQVRWPLLWNLLGRYFNEDLDIQHGSVDGAMAAAVRDGPLEHRRSILKEWRSWNATEGAVDDIRPFLEDGFGVALWFESSTDARCFMNRLYEQLIVGVRTETAPAAGHGRRGPE
jgi:hypothetical protein